MPDPVLYLKAMCAAACVSAMVVLTLGRLIRAAGRNLASGGCKPTGSSSFLAASNLASVLGVGSGLAAGYFVLQLHLDWPPVNGLGRLLLIVIPAVIGIEVVACLEPVPRWCVWLMRVILAAATGRILLHGSVYLGGPHREWTILQSWVVLTLSAGILAATWAILSSLSRRSPGAIVPLAVGFAIQSATIVIMLAGYVAGGAAAIPMTAAVVGSTVASGLCVKHPDCQGTIAIGVVGLFGLLFVGRFFGALSSVSALSLFLAPLLCCAIEIPRLRRQPRWFSGMICLLLVLIPLFIVVILAKRHFDLNTAPLLGGLPFRLYVDHFTITPVEV